MSKNTGKKAVAAVTTTTGSEVIGTGDVSNLKDVLPEGTAAVAAGDANTALPEGTAVAAGTPAPAGKSTKLAGLLAAQKAAAPATPAPQAADANNASAVAAARARATTSTIKSTPQQYDDAGNRMQRRNYSIKERQLVMIRSVKGKMIHLTTDINYTNRTQQAAVSKARTELGKQATIKPIVVWDDLEVIVLADRYDINEVQVEKAKLYDKLASEGWTMLGKRPNVLPKPEAQQPAAAAAPAVTTEAAAPATTEEPVAEAKVESTEAATTDAPADGAAEEQVPA